MATKKTKWKDASKERPQEGQAVLVASYNPNCPKDIICNICEYREDEFWNILNYKEIEPQKNAVVIDCALKYKIYGVKAWRDAKEIFLEANKFFVNQ